MIKLDIKERISCAVLVTRITCEIRGKGFEQSSTQIPKRYIIYDGKLTTATQNPRYCQKTVITAHVIGCYNCRISVDWCRWYENDKLQNNGHVAD